MVKQQKKIMSDVIFERIKQSMNFKEWDKEINKLTDPQEKFAAEYEMYKEVQKHAILEIDKLTDDEFSKLKNQNNRELRKFWKNFGIQYFDDMLRSGETSLGEFDKELVQGQIVYEYLNRKFTKAEKVALSKKKTLKRLWILAKLENLVFKTEVGAKLYQFQPYFQINEIISRRFGFDENWGIAIAILATHENLVKKKLDDLGMNKMEIGKLSKNQGLDPLVNKLAELIELNEKRKPSLLFYKSSALRKVRNRLEHEGYDQIVTHKEVQDLLKDIKNFESELFPPEKNEK